MDEEYINPPYNGRERMEIKYAEEVQTKHSLEIQIRILRHQLRRMRLRLNEERHNTQYEHDLSEMWASEYIKLAEDLTK